MLEREEPTDGVWVGVLVDVGVEEGVGEGDGPATSEKEEEVPVYVRPLCPIAESLALYVLNPDGTNAAGSV